MAVHSESVEPVDSAARKEIHAGRLGEGEPRSRRRLKRIEEIEVGDWVWAFDQASNRRIARRVRRLFRSKDRAVLDLVCTSSSGGEQIISGTTEHPFWVEGKGWTPLRLLASGDALKGIDGFGAARVVEVRDTGRTANVFNFEVEGAHNYFVSGDGVLVHNMSVMDKIAAAIVELDLDTQYWRSTFPQSRHVPGPRVDLGRHIGYEGMSTARENIAGGGEDILSAHSGYAFNEGGPDQIFVVPEGSAVTLLRPGVEVYREHDRAIQEGDWTGVGNLARKAAARLPLSEVERRHLEAAGKNGGIHPDFEGAATYLPGAVLPEYQFKAPRNVPVYSGNYSIEEGRFRSLSDLVPANSGHLSISSCTFLWNRGLGSRALSFDGYEPLQHVLSLPGLWTADPETGEWVPDAVGDEQFNANWRVHTGNRPGEPRSGRARVDGNEWDGGPPARVRGIATGNKSQREEIRRLTLSLRDFAATQNGVMLVAHGDSVSVAGKNTAATTALYLSKLALDLGGSGQPVRIMSCELANGVVPGWMLKNGQSAWGVALKNDLFIWPDDEQHPPTGAVPVAPSRPHDAIVHYENAATRAVKLLPYAQSKRVFLPVLQGRLERTNGAEPEEISELFRYDPVPATNDIDKYTVAGNRLGPRPKKGRKGADMAWIDPVSGQIVYGKFRSSLTAQSIPPTSAAPERPAPDVAPHPAERQLSDGAAPTGVASIYAQPFTADVVHDFSASGARLHQDIEAKMWARLERAANPTVAFITSFSPDLVFDGNRFSMRDGTDRGANIPYSHAAKAYALPAGTNLSSVKVPLENIRTGEPLTEGHHLARAVVNVHGSRISRSKWETPDKWYFPLPEGTSLVVHAPPGSALRGEVTHQIILDRYTHRIYRERLDVEYSNQTWTRSTSHYGALQRAFGHTANWATVNVFTVPEIVREDGSEVMPWVAARNVLTPNLGELHLATCNGLNRMLDNRLVLGKTSIFRSIPQLGGRDTFEDLPAHQYLLQPSEGPQLFSSRDAVEAAWRMAGFESPRWWRQRP